MMICEKMLNRESAHLLILTYGTIHLYLMELEQDKAQKSRINLTATFIALLQKKVAIVTPALTLSARGLR